jgi:DNA-binding transcriptional regulator YiaG
MKNANYDNKLIMVLDIAKRSGMVLSTIADKLGVGRSTVRSWKRGVHLPPNPDEVLRTMLADAKFLEKIDLDTYDIKKLRSEFGITDHYLAEELGITSEALSQQIDKGISNWNRKKELQEAIRSIGKNIRMGRV